MNDKQLEYIKACVLVAATSRHFVWTTDADPLVGMTFYQGVLWDNLTAAITALEELEEDRNFDPATWEYTT